MKTKVLGKLKPKVASLGFNEEELEGVANQIAGTLQADATDQQIDTAIELFLPFLQVSQKVATRVINAAKPKPEPKEGDKKEIDGAAHTFKNGKWVKDEGSKPDKEENAELKALREQIETLTKTVATLSSTKLSEQRTTLFEAKIDKLPPKQKAEALRNFKRMSFTDDDDFNAYMAETDTSVAEIIQELANNGLKKMTKVGGGSSTTEPETVSPEVQKRIDERAAAKVEAPIQGLK